MLSGATGIHLKICWWYIEKVLYKYLKTSTGKTKLVLFISLPVYVFFFSDKPFLYIYLHTTVMTNEFLQTKGGDVMKYRWYKCKMQSVKHTRGFMGVWLTLCVSTLSICSLTDVFNISMFWTAAVYTSNITAKSTL